MTELLFQSQEDVTSHLNSLIKSVEFLREVWLYLLPTISLLDDLSYMNSPSHQQYYYGKWERCLPTNPLHPISHHVLWVRQHLGYFRSVFSVHGLSIISCRLSVIFIDVIFLLRLKLCPCTPGTPLEGQEWQHFSPPPPTSTCIPAFCWWMWDEHI